MVLCTLSICREGSADHRLDGRLALPITDAQGTSNPRPGRAIRRRRKRRRKPGRWTNWGKRDINDNLLTEFLWKMMDKE